MHKKPLVAVFVLGLLLTATAFGWAAPVPPGDGVFLRESGRDKASPAQRVEETGTSVIIQAGTPLSVQGTFCNGYWQGPQTYRIPGWMTGGETYAVFQDPTSSWPYSFGVGCDPMIPPDLTFNVTGTVWRWTKRPTSEGFINPYTYQIQPVIFDVDLTIPACPVPGGVKQAGPVYLVTLNNPNPSGGMTFELHLPFLIEACVTGPYFIGAYLPVVFDPANGAQILTDDGGFYWPGPVVGQLCRTYNEYGAGWCDLNDPAQCAWFELNLLMWSEGYNPLDPATLCTPGLCDYQYWYDGVRQNDDWTNYYGLPTATRQKLGVRFMSDCQDTLKGVSFGLYSQAGAPDILVEVWAGDGAGSSCGVSPLPGTLLEQVLVPYASVVFYPLVNDVVLADHVWGTLNGGLPEAIFVTVTEASGGVNGVTGLQAGPPVTAGCPPDPHSIAFYGPTAPLPGWHYLAEAPTAYTQREFWMDAYICKEQCPIVEDACLPPGPDDWNTLGHDYQRTSASSMNLGDPCKVRAQWSTFMPRLSNFTNPVIAGDRVYVSSDAEVNMYDLATGIPVATVGTFPYTGGAVRSNVTVEGNRVFVTGGNARSVSCWSADLSTNFWSNTQIDVGAPGINLGDNGPLPTQNRFGSAAVYAVGLDSIVVVSTEMVGVNNGRLYALDVLTGFLYAGWGANNPIMLDKGAFHAPAYDGTNLYVGTADAILGNGSIYSFNAATGAMNWNYKDLAAAAEGFPGGVSVDGDAVYAASMIDQSTDMGHRYSIDKTTGVPNWRHQQGGAIFAAPTIGRNFVYIPQNIPSAGVLMVDKVLGKAVYNWAAIGVGPVSGPVTLTCDKYLFAGDRNGYWYLLNATDQSMEWRREFTGIVNGTAIAHHSNGDDFVVVNARSSATGPAGAGVVTGWRLNQTVRPFLRQLVYATPDILVPLNSGDNLGPYTETGVYANDGCVGLNITNTNYWDPAPAAKTFSQIQQKYAAAYVDRKIGSDYVTYFEGGQPSKKARLAGAGVMADQELTVFDKEIEAVHSSFAAKGARSATAAGAMDILRTHAVTYSANPILPGGITDLTWLYDGTGLGRGVDDEIIESVTDDPDVYPEDLDYSPIGHPALMVHYIGGCPEDYTTMTWNTLGAPNVEIVRNHGAMGDSDPGSLTWGADANWNTSIFDGTFMIMGDSSATIGGAQMYLDYYDFHKLFVPDPRVSDATCGFDRGTDVHMGWRRDLNTTCPWEKVEILGSWVQSGYSDTNFNFAPTSPMATIGTQIRQTEIGANDPLYGDFKLIQWTVNNRDAVAKTGLKGATYFDWDVAPGGADVAMISDNFNGYALWDSKAPRYAYGMFDPNQPTAYCGVDPTEFSPYKIYASASGIVYGHTPGRWVGDGQPLDQAYGWFLCTRPPFRFNETSLPGPEDRGGWLVSDPFPLEAKGDLLGRDSYDVIQAMYAVPAVSNTDAGIDALAVDVAKRAARWSGFARGDVNDDGCVDLGDVCWMNSGNQIYPDTYCADVDLIGGEGDLADQAYLLAYVSGLGPAPLGKFRFAY